jgi:long-chain acyl-CoA synthetase
MHLIDMLERAVGQSPNKDFLVYENDKRSYKKFYGQVKHFAGGLQKLGVQKGDKVAILLNNSCEFVIAYYAAVYIGAVAVPLNVFLKMEEVAFIINDCMAKAFVTSSDFKDIAEKLNINRIRSLQAMIATDEIMCNNSVKFSEVLAGPEVEPSDINENDLAVIIYTSGTTGHPKGAMLSHRNLVSNVAASCKAIKVFKNDRFVLFLPMFHSFTFTVCVNLPIYCQSTVFVLKSIQPFSKIIKSIFFDRISVFVAIPQVYNVLSLKKIPGFIKMLMPIRVCVSGAAPLAGEVLKRFEERFKVPLIEGYGLSEASPVVSVNPLDGVRKEGSVGPAIPGVTIKILDDEGKELKQGEVGEIAVIGPNVMMGYYNKADETALIMKNGMLLSGDIGKLDEDGYLFILDRKKDLILVNGMNLYPREVEEVLYKHEAIQDGVVVGKKDAMHGEIPIGVVKLKEGKNATEAELKKFCKQHLANFKIPHRIEFWEELPRTGTGKVLKREIRRIINEKK